MLMSLIQVLGMPCFGRELLTSENEEKIEITFAAISEETAKILETWKYKAPYDFYNHSEPIEFYLNPENQYHIAFLEDEILGFYCLGLECQVPGGDYKDKVLDIGISLNPKFIGKGLGTIFFNAVTEHIKEKEKPQILRLTVADFNLAAIKVYEKTGFRKKASFKAKSGVKFSVFLMENS